MIYIVLFGCLISIGIAIAISNDEVGVPLAIIGIVGGVVLSLVLITVHVNAVGSIQQIEQLRKQVRELGEDARTEDILGKVADINMKLAACRAMNKVPTLDLFYPDKLCEVPEIIIPREENE